LISFGKQSKVMIEQARQELLNKAFYATHANYSTILGDHSGDCAIIELKHLCFFHDDYNTSDYWFSLDGCDNSEAVSVDEHRPTFVNLRNSDHYRFTL